MPIALADVTTLLREVFEANGTLSPSAASVAQALVQAEAAGQYGHGLRRVVPYVSQLRTGKVDGQALPILSRPRPGVIAIDAAHGFAYPAIDLAVQALPAAARAQGIAVARIGRSHHAGVAGLAVERLAEEGLMAIMVANAPASMAAWGGRKRIFGTNPIAFAAPVAGADPLVIDLALSTVAAGKVVAAQQRGERIPEGWAFDPDGNPTTDPELALKGVLSPSGGAKGAALAMMVEVLAAGLTGANFSYEASSFFDADGAPPSVGQVIIAIDPGPGNAAARFAELAGEMTSEEGVRLPGRRGQNCRREALRVGLEVNPSLLATIEELRRV